MSDKPLAELLCVACGEAIGAEWCVAELRSGADPTSFTGAIWHHRCGEIVWQPGFFPGRELAQQREQQRQETSATT